MTIEDLEFSIGDALRFVDRATLIKAKTKTPELSEQDAKTVVRLSMDVSRALMDLRKEAK